VYIQRILATILQYRDTIFEKGTMPTPHKANKAHKQKTKHKNYDPPPTDSSKPALAT
jgi:hypothetical protein